MTARVDIAQAPGTVQTASGFIDLGATVAEFMEANIYIDVTAVAGTTPSLTLTYQCSALGSIFIDHTSGAAITAVGKQLLKIPANLGNFGRLAWAITGTAPSFTFSVAVGLKRP